MKATYRVDESAVRSVPEPAFTKSWHPISHEKLLDAIGYTCHKLGTLVMRKDFTLSEDGLDMFGTMTLDMQVEGQDLSISFRNSMKKHFAVGFCAGRFVIVCSNMSFAGKFVEFRKHTSGLDVSVLRELTFKAIDCVKADTQNFLNWQDSMVEMELLPIDFKRLTFDAMLQGVFPPSKFTRFLECYSDEVLLSGSNLSSFYGGVTRLQRDNSLFAIQQSTSLLNKLCQEEMDRRIL